MTSDDPVVVLGANTFRQRIPLGDWQLARAFARLGRQVLFVDPPRNAATLARGHRAGQPVRYVEDGVQVTGVGLATGRPGTRLERVQELVATAQVDAFVRSRTGGRLPVVVATHPLQARFCGLRRQSLVYWQKDRQWASERVRDRDAVARMHGTLLRTADVVTGVSQEIAEDNLAQGVDCRVIPNGVDAEHWARPRDIPADLAAVPGPRAVFAGAWGWRVDADLVARLARRNPGISIVVVGGDRPAGFDAPTVHFLGTRSYDELPSYVQHCAAGLIPYVDNTFNRASSPLKMFEYLAAGVPVVAAGISPAPSGSGVVMVSGDDEWSRTLQEVVGRSSGAGDEGRADFAVANDWTGRAQLLLDLVDEGRAQDR